MSKVLPFEWSNSLASKLFSIFILLNFSIVWVLGFILCNINIDLNPSIVCLFLILLASSAILLRWIVMSDRLSVLIRFKLNCECWLELGTRIALILVLIVWALSRSRSSRSLWILLLIDVWKHLLSVPFFLIQSWNIIVVYSIDSQYLASYEFYR
jgi:hypothetical protein